mmetsp:Transcript_2999/g.9346  ORF Transcript_2999/g.9346 Transcript_2999/m.9346 type:complete len:258 (-) Transcript_2999:59-832(-)
MVHRRAPPLPLRHARPDHVADPVRRPGRADGGGDEDRLRPAGARGGPREARAQPDDGRLLPDPRLEAEAPPLELGDDAVARPARRRRAAAAARRRRAAAAADPAAAAGRERSDARRVERAARRARGGAAAVALGRAELDVTGRHDARDLPRAARAAVRVEDRGAVLAQVPPVHRAHRERGDGAGADDALQGQGGPAAVQDPGGLVPIGHPEGGRRRAALHGRVFAIVKRTEAVAGTPFGRAASLTVFLTTSVSGLGN